MKVCLVDDESSQLIYLKSLLEKYSDQHNYLIQSYIYHSAEEVLFECGDIFPYDLMILDINMARVNGMELARRVRQFDKSIKIVFLSGIADYVYEGYEVQAYRYILKPVKEDLFFEMLESLETSISKEKEYLIVNLSGDSQKFELDKIEYIEALGHYIIINIDGIEQIVTYSISDIQKELEGKGFVRTHRSFMVNLKHVEQIKKDICILSRGGKVPISRNSYKHVNNAFIEFYRGVGK